MNKALHVLHAVPDMNVGGLENFIMNIFRNIDRGRVQFDFLMHHSYDSFFDDEIRSLGGAIYRYPVVENKNLFGYSRYVERLLGEHPEIGVVHSHMCSTGYFTLGAARRAGCVMRVCHSHNTSHDRTVKGCAKWALSRLAPLNANILLACSTEAGKYLFGNRPFELQRNAIDTKRFAFNENKRETIRAEYGIGDSLVVGHIGRLTEAKNHPFIIRVFDEVRRRRPDARLLLVGDGEERVKSAVYRLVRELGLSDSVIFAGVHPNTEDFYSAFDVFLFPSLFEGLPLTGVEAQCAGLPCLFSDAITRELDISDFARFLPLGDGAERWAEAVLASTDASASRTVGLRQVRAAGYDAALSSEKLANLYLSTVESAR